MVDTARGHRGHHDDVFVSSEATRLHDAALRAVLRRYTERWGSVEGAQFALVQLLLEDCRLAVVEDRLPTVWTGATLRRELARRCGSDIADDSLKKALRRFRSRLHELHDPAHGYKIIVTIDRADYGIEVRGPRQVDRTDGTKGIFVIATPPVLLRTSDDDLTAQMTASAFPLAAIAYVAEEDIATSIVEDLRESSRSRLGLFGLPGSGKTELAKELARRLGGTLSTRQKFVNAGRRDPDDVRQDLNALLRDSVADQQSSPDAARTVLVLDDLHDVAVLDRWIEPRECTLIVTAREAFPIAGCTWVARRGVSRDVARNILARTSRRSDFSERSYGCVDVHGERIAAPDVADDICYLSGWMPGAIAQAGAYLAAHPHIEPTAYRMALGNQWLEPSRPPWRVTTPVESVVEESVSELTEQEQRLLVRLAVFSDWFTRRAASYVLDGADVVDRLVSRCLLEYDGTNNAFRFPYFSHTLLEERLQDDPREAAFAARMCAFLLTEHVETALQRQSAADWQALFVMRRSIVASLYWAMHRKASDRVAASALRSFAHLLARDNAGPRLFDDVERETLLAHVTNAPKS